MLLHALALSLITLVPPAVGAGECVVIAPLAGPETAFGGDDCSRRTLPASTFKIPHALIALQTRVVTARSVIRWDGVKRDYDAWNRDQTLESAIRMSAVWVFQQFATAIGRDRELEYLKKFQLRLGGVRARRHQLLAERRPADLSDRGARVPPPHVHVRPAGGSRPHRRGQGGSDDAAREVRECGGRARVRAALARRHHRPRQERQRDGERRAGQLAGRRARERRPAVCVREPRPRQGGDARHHLRRRPRAFACSTRSTPQRSRSPRRPAATGSSSCGRRASRRSASMRRTRIPARAESAASRRSPPSTRATAAKSWR